MTQNDEDIPTLDLHFRPKRIGAKLRAIRHHLGLSQSQMKDRIGFPGYYGRISDYERRVRMPSMMLLLAYARAAKVPLEEIVDDEMELQF